MTTKKKTTAGANLEMRTRLNRALALSEQTTAALVDATAVAEGNNATVLVEAVKTLRMIANTHLSRSGPMTPDEKLAKWFQALAQNALKRMGLRL
jgi:hypothetical protein